MLEREQAAVLEALRASPDEMTSRQVYEALERSLPQHTVAIALGGLVHRRLASRRSERRGRRRAVIYFRAIDSRP